MPTFLNDIKNTAIGGASIPPQAALVASANGTGVDFLLADGPVSAIVTAGATDFASSDETYVVKLQESDTSGGTYTDVVGAGGVTPTVSVTAANSVVYLSGNQRTKRWVRAVITIGGTTPSIFVAVTLVARKKITGSGGGTQL